MINRVLPMGHVAGWLYCGFMWNTFDTRALCPACEKQHLLTGCPRCHESTAHERWYEGRRAH